MKSPQLIGNEQASLERSPGQTTPEYWRSLEELAETKEFQQWVYREFPAGAPEWEE
jgi:MoCo/4Fe-4S cofactor protein with predicted Tat translocation signal